MQSAERNKRILVICPHPIGRVPGQRLKFEQYYKSWEDAGYEVVVKPFMNDHFQDIVYKQGKLVQKVIRTIGAYLNRFSLLFSIRKYDIVYVFLWVTPFGPPLFEILVKQLAKKLVYDIDDLVYLKKTSPANRFISIFKSSRKIFYMLKNAGHVFVSTQKLLDKAKQYNKNISVVPATIDMSGYPLRTVSANKKTVIGWSGSHTTSKYLHLLDDVLKRISAQYDVSIHVMGDPDFSIDGLNNIELVHWSPANEIPALMKFDIGLHPVPDEEWTLGKSGGKLVQYMAAGLPIIATNNVPNAAAVEDGVTGFLVTTDEEWFEKISLLITDAEARNAMSHRSYERAVAKYSIDNYTNVYLNAFENV